MMRLSEAPSHSDWYEVLRLEGEAALAERLTEMGLVPGARVFVRGRLPLGGPVVIQLGNGFLALRENEAHCLCLMARSEA